MIKARDDNIKKWYTESEFIDIETGEVFKKMPKNYIKIETNKKTKIDEKFKIGVIKYSTTIRRHPQQRIEFPTG